MNWDIYFMKIARTVAMKSTCLRRQVGAVLVKDNKIVSTGYNGAPKGLRHCTNIGHCRKDKLNIASGKGHEYCRAVHAEMNALMQSSNTENTTIYVTTSPCSNCLKQLINAGVKRIITCESYPDTFSVELLQESELEYKVLTEEII